MTSTRKISLTVGVLFILTFITSIGAVFAYGPAFSDPHYITGAGSDAPVSFGAFLELLLILTNIGCAIVLFPILKRQNEALSLAYIAERIVEGAFILVGLISLLTISTLRQTATSADAASLLPIGTTLLATHDWSFLLLGFADAIGTGLILGWLMYRSGLVGQRVALLGIVGGSLLLVAASGVLLGAIPSGSALQKILTVPEIIWEAFLGLWLTFKGFKATAATLAVDSGDTEPRATGARTHGPVAAAGVA
jgi:hypothetical protein